MYGTGPISAPSLIHTEGKETDAHTELFVSACVFPRDADGRPAFGGNTEASVISAIMTGEPLPLSSLQPLTPPALGCLVRRYLAKAPEDCWQAASNVADAPRARFCAAARRVA